MVGQYVHLPRQVQCVGIIFLVSFSAGGYEIEAWVVLKSQVDRLGFYWIPTSVGGRVSGGSFRIPPASLVAFGIAFIPLMGHGQPGVNFIKEFECLLRKSVFRDRSICRSDI